MGWKKLTYHRQKKTFRSVVQAHLVMAFQDRCHLGEEWVEAPRDDAVAGVPDQGHGLCDIRGVGHGASALSIGLFEDLFICPLPCIIGVVRSPVRIALR
jgi:hypothetical protein